MTQRGADGATPSAPSSLPARHAQRPPKVTRRHSYRGLLRATVALGLTIAVVWRSHPAEIVRAAGGARTEWIAAAIALVLIDRTLMAWRWIALLGVLNRDTRPPLPTLLRIFFISTFVGTFLPASVGSDAARAYGLARSRVAAAPAVASVLMDRLLGVVSLLIVTLAGLTVARDLLAEPGIVAALSVTSVVCGLCLVLVFSTRAGSLATRLIALSSVRTIRRAGEELIAAVQAYRAAQATLVAVLAASIAVQLLRIAQALALGFSLSLAAPAVAYLAFVPIILLVMLLPISVNGLGTSQLAFAWLFARAGVPAPEAVALSFLFLGLGVLGNLPGGILYLFAPPTAKISEP
jgi:uncharacterized protein (TIRG00374 family)